IVAYTCEVNAVLVGNQNVTCLPNGTWSQTPECRPDCGAPPPYPFGNPNARKGRPTASVTLLDNTWMGTLYKSKARYNCTVRYFGIKGVDIATCKLNGKWSIENIKTDCSFINCFEIPNVKDAIVVHKPENTYLGAKVVYECLSNTTQAEKQDITPQLKYIYPVAVQQKPKGPNSIYVTECLPNGWSPIPICDE
ncbi:unnamed protein product, partial [Owenia fusiformis]